MNWKALTGMFTEKDGTLDEIVVIITVLVATGLGLELRNYLFTTVPIAVNGAVFYVHPTFSLSEFGDGMLKMGTGAGVWQALRGGVRAWSAGRQPQPSTPGESAS